ncbi:MAG: aspartate aminotransferase family protein [Gemmatimonadetes bacterium]|nr:aspartate aminotransferase family protein [Gemmatimonadota bacterium]
MVRRFGERLPRLRTRVPGPSSEAVVRRLRAVESPNLVCVAPAPPIVWRQARGANVRDVDGNIYIDLTAGFAVAAAGHSNRRVARAIGAQARRLAHGLGDVHPPEIKLRLLERLSELAPGRLKVTILASAGAEAVEVALKTAWLRTGRPGVLAFTGGYHGLTLGALATTWRREFRDPFRAQLCPGVLFAPYAVPYQAGGADAALATALQETERLLVEAAAAGAPVGAILVEPVQGRGGIVVPAAGFLAGLRSFCDGRELVLIFDEVYTGFGRTGRWFACEHAGVVPDILVVGKALSGALPLSAAVGTREVMEAWPASMGEAIHTSTFLGNPIACAAALAHLEEIERRGLVERARHLGEWLSARLQTWKERHTAVGDVRGLGLMQGVELVEHRGTRRPATEMAARVVQAALGRGVLLLAEGPSANVLAFTPPLVITRLQLEYAVDVVEEEVARAASS